MKQARMLNPGEIAIEEAPVPEIRDGEALLRVRRIGVCGSDIHVYHGKHPYTSYPIIQGHELSGEIAEVGAGVVGLKPGDHATLQPQVTCGRCYPCRHGDYHICDELKVMGFQTDGGAREYFAVPADKLIKLPENMTLDEGALVEPAAVAVHALKRSTGVAGKKVLVLGAGPIGNLVAQVAKGLGARRVMVTDVSDLRLQLAKECGADFAVNTRGRDFTEAIVSAFGPDRADIIYDCAGNNTTINQAIYAARKGSTILLVAVFAGMAAVDLAVLNDKELNLNTTMMFRHEHFQKGIELVAEGKVRLKPLQSIHFPFEQWADAYRYIDDHRETTMKVIIDVQK